jgi:predicted glycogen debranching enzyme
MKKCYVLSNKKTMFFRLTNSVFGSKWCGLWFPSTKVMDYFAFNVNGEWLSEHNFKEFSIKNGTAEHLYEFGDLAVRESITVPKDIPGIIIVLNIENKGESGKFKVIMKPGINIRDIGENSHTRVYKIVETDPLYITSEMGDLAMRSDARVDFLVDERYIAHTPGAYTHEWSWNDEIEQSVFEPGIAQIELDIRKGTSKSVSFMISDRQNLYGLADCKKIIKERQNIEASKSGLYSDSAIDTMARTMGSFRNESHIGSGFFAGLPWFQSYWARDTCHSVFAMSNLGMWDEVKKSLITLSRYERDGVIPNTLYLSGVPTYNSSDSSPLFIIALHHHISYSKDYKLLKQMMPVVSRILERGERLVDNGLVLSGPGESWMDTLKRDGHCIDIQSLWTEAFLRASELENKRYISIANSMIRRINSDFWRDGNFIDVLQDSSSTRPNVLFPLFFGHLEKEKAISALSKLESDEFTSKTGIRSLSSLDPLYHPRAYHDGTVWGLLTGMMCHSEFMYNRVDQGFRYLDIVKNNLGLRCADSIDEVYDGDTGFPMGCVSQAWSISPIIKTVDEMILGINPDTDENITFEPRILPGMSFERKSLKIGNDIINISLSDGVFRIKGLKENHLKARTSYKFEVI